MYNANSAVRIGLDFGSAKLDESVISTNQMFANGNSYLKSIVFPSELSQSLTFGNQYFFTNPSLEYVQFPKNIAGLGNAMFSSYSSSYLPAATASLKVEIPETVKNLNNAFMGTTNLTQIILNEGLEIILPGDFIYCNNLKSIEIPSTVKSIGYNAFLGCTSLKKLVLKNGLESIARNAFSSAFSEDIEPFDIPSTVKTLEDGVFEHSKIKTAKIPGTVTSIGKYLFQDCTKLEFCEINTKNIPSYTINFCSALKSLVIGENVESIASTIVYNPDNIPSLTSVEFKNPKGWSVSDGVGPIPEKDLKDKAKAAQLIKQYYNKTWTRS